MRPYLRWMWSVARKELLDIGRDRGSPVGDYAEPFRFTGALRTVTVTMDADQALDGDAVGAAEMARE